MQALEQVGSWPVPHAAAGVVVGGAPVATTGDADRRFGLASVTKLLTTLAVLVAVEEGTLGLDEPAGPEGSTVRHLLAHASGLPFEGSVAIARPGARRIYSNEGMDVLGSTLASAAGMSFERYVREAVLDPLGMTATAWPPSRWGPASAGAAAPLVDVLRLAAELQRPTLVAAATLTEATTVQFPGLAGMVPGFGKMDPCDWGLGFELRSTKAPHWTGRGNSPGTFGHFGGSGTFLWVDPDAGVACAALTDRDFDAWAKTAWPALADAVLAEVSPRS